MHNKSPRAIPETTVFELIDWLKGGRFRLAITSLHSRLDLLWHKILEAVQAEQKAPSE